MTSILFANMGHEEDLRIKEAFGNDYDVAIVKSPGELNGREANQDLVLLDHLFVERYGVDSMTGLMEKSPMPVIFLSSPEDSDGALKMMEKLGSANCIVKTGDYYPLIDYAVRYEIERCARERKMKQAIFTLKKRIDELEEESIKSETDTAPPKDINVDMLEQIVFIFKRGEIDLPSHPRLSQKFLELIEKGASLQKIAEILKRDAAISSKLISISNSPFYRGMSKYKTLEQAIGRLGLKTTKQYVDAILHRALYTTKNTNFTEIIERLWEHSLSCAYASQAVSEILRLHLPDDAFTLGLLHDIGKLVLIQTIAELQKRKKIGESIDREEIFLTINTHHGKFGHSLLKLWKFGDGYLDVASFHDHLETAETLSKELMVVHFSNLLVKSMGYHLGIEETIELEDVLSRQLLKLTDEMVGEARDRVSRLMEETRTIFS